MKVGLLTSVRGKRKYGAQYGVILNYLQKRGHEVVHNLDISEEDLGPLPYPQREELFVSFYKKLLDCEVIVAECSMQSLQVGYALSFMRSNGKPIIALYMKNSDNDLGPIRDMFSSIENVVIYEYEDEELPSVLDEAMEYMEPHLDKRFTIIFPAHLLAKIEEKSQKLTVPKSVYIRQLIEKDLTSDNS